MRSSRSTFLGVLLLAAGLLAACGDGSPCSASPQRKAAHRYDVRAGDDLFGRLKELKPGDDVVIHAGTYRTPGFFEVTWRGTARAPIVVRGAPGEPRPVIVGIPSQNVLDIDGSHFRLSRLDVRGGSHGVRLGNADHATLDDLRVHDVMDVGISCNRPGDRCDGLTIRRSEVYDTGRGRHDFGEGIYLGCQHGECSVVHSGIEDNFVHDTHGFGGDGIELKVGSENNVVRGNTVLRTRGGGIVIAGCETPDGNRVAHVGPPGGGEPYPQGACGPG